MTRYLTTFGATRAEAIFRVRGRNQAVVGTIDVESARGNAFGPDDEAFLQDCAVALAPSWPQGMQPNVPWTLPARWRRFGRNAQCTPSFLSAAPAGRSSSAIR